MVDLKQSGWICKHIYNEDRQPTGQYYLKYIHYTCLLHRENTGCN